MSTLYRWWAALLLVAVVVQVGLAGYGAFYAAHKIDHSTPKLITDKSFAHGFSAHDALGYLVVLGGIVLLVIAAAGRQGRTRIKWTGLLAGLLVLQVILAALGYAVAALGFFHPINAFVIVAVSGSIAREAWRREPVTTTQAAAAG